MKISVVIPNYNGEKYIEKCLESLYNQSFTDYEVIIVDNASSDGSLEMLRASGYDFKLIENSENLGFAAAVNQGIRASKGKYVALLNNDTEVERDWLLGLYKAIVEDRKIFAVSSKMVRYDDRSIMDDAGDNYTILGWAYKIGDGEPVSKYTKSFEVFSACGGAALYRKSVFKKIGLFDESFFAYMEDVDICYRAKLHGYYNVFCPDAVVYHIGSATSGSKYNDFKVRLAARNNMLVVWKNMPVWQIVLNGPFLLVGELVKWLFMVKKGYGKVYLEGKMSAIRMIRKNGCNKSRSRHALMIQKELMTNMVEYFKYYFTKS